MLQEFSNSVCCGCFYDYCRWCSSETNALFYLTHYVGDYHTPHYWRLTCWRVNHSSRSPSSDRLVQQRWIVRPLPRKVRMLENFLFTLVSTRVIASVSRCTFTVCQTHTFCFSRTYLQETMIQMHMCKYPFLCLQLWEKLRDHSKIISFFDFY